jgi:hypothetical protein
MKDLERWAADQCFASEAKWIAPAPIDTTEVRQSIFDWGQAHGYTLAQTEIDDLLNRIEEARR